MRDVDLALSDISDIRAQLVASTRFLGISPGFNTVLAFLAFAVALMQTWQPAPGQGDFTYIAVWAAVLVASFFITAVQAISRSHRLHGRMAGVLLQSVAQKILPFIVAGVILTCVICAYAPESIRLLPGLWQLLIGLLGFAVLTGVPRGLIWVAGWYFCSGILVLAVAGQTGALSPWMMGIPLFVGQLAAAHCFSRANGESHVCKKI